MNLYALQRFNTASQIENGMETLISRIKSQEPKRIGLKNKNAATWFYQYCEDDEEVTGKEHPEHDRVHGKWESYGFLREWDYFSADYYLLPTMAYDMYYNKEEYMEFWDRCRDDVERFRNASLS